MRPKRVTATGGVGIVYSEVIPLDWRKEDFKVGLAVDLVGAAAGTYTVEHTFDDVSATDFDASTAKWFDHEVLASQTTDQDGNYAFPCRATRLKLHAGFSGDANYTVIMAG